MCVASQELDVPNQDATNGAQMILKKFESGIPGFVAAEEAETCIVCCEVGTTLRIDIPREMQEKYDLAPNEHVIFSQKMDRGVDGRDQIIVRSERYIPLKEFPEGTKAEVQIAFPRCEDPHDRDLMINSLEEKTSIAA